MEWIEEEINIIIQTARHQWIPVVKQPTDSDKASSQALEQPDLLLSQKDNHEIKWTEAEASDSSQWKQTLKV
jgi:ABC-type uncharacterized transport system substrate-binding protein